MDQRVSQTCGKSVAHPYVAECSMSGLEDINCFSMGVHQGLLKHRSASRGKTEFATLHSVLLGLLILRYYSQTQR